MREFRRASFAGIGQEKKAFIVFFKPGDEFGGALEQTVAVVDHPVHVDDEGVLCTDYREIGFF